LSAGALILTPHIKLAGYPRFDCDDNTVKLKNLKALGLLKFEFFPHYSDSPRLRRALISYSRKNKKPIFASDDGGGLVVDNGWITFYGKVFVFYRGKRTRMN
jgi:dipeptidase E